MGICRRVALSWVAVEGRPATALKYKFLRKSLTCCLPLICQSCSSSSLAMLKLSQRITDSGSKTLSALEGWHLTLTNLCTPRGPPPPRWNRKERWAHFSFHPFFIKFRLWHSFDVKHLSPTGKKIDNNSLPSYKPPLLCPSFILINLLCLLMVLNSILVFQSSFLALPPLLLLLTGHKGNLTNKQDLI